MKTNSQYEELEASRNYWRDNANKAYREYLISIAADLGNINDFLRDQCYGPWKVIDTTTHKDGTIVETAQRVVKKVKHD